jgi:Rha family phage regulatory protein
MNELVVLNPKGQKVTTSLLVASKFNKSHKNVLRAIDNLSCSQEFNRLNFEPTSYTDSQGRDQIMFYITKDGFMMLAFGFNGKDASDLKEKFINAFNEGQEAVRILKDDDAIILRSIEILNQRLVEKNIQLSVKDEQLEIAANIIKESVPIIKYYKEVLNSSTGYPITIIASELGMTAKKLNQLLVDNGVQRRLGKDDYITYVLCAEYLNKGLTTSYTVKYIDRNGVEHTKIQTIWTEKGRELIMNNVRNEIWK